MKRIIALVSFVFFSICAFGQDTEAQSNASLGDLFNDPMMPLYLVSVFVIIVALLAAFVSVYMIRVINMMTAQAEKHNAEALGIAYKPTQTWWQRFNNTMNAAVPVEEEQSIEMDHSYDGIKELDNHLPPWWKWLFYATIVWSVIYVIVFHVSDLMPLQIDEYQLEVASAEEQAIKLRVSQPIQEIDENALTFSRDSVTLIEAGKTVFTVNNCGSCHRADGGGNSIGPNLTDEYWLHGGHIKAVFTTIKNGVVEKGMPAWGKTLSPRQVRDVTFYILSLQGTNPENAKKSQGEKYDGVDVKQDTVGVVRASL